MTEDSSLTPGVMLLMILACCLLLANIYYAQPVLGTIASSLSILPAASGTMVMASQLGYISGLLFLAPLGDIMENRKLCSAMTLGAAIASLASSIAPNMPVFLAGTFHMGLFASATQILVVFAVALGGAERSGKILGIMACGLFLGIAASRPLSSFITGEIGWRKVYLISGLALLATSATLFYMLPALKAQGGRIKYKSVLISMARLIIYPGLIRNTIISSGAFFSFIMFWSCMPLHLSKYLGCSQSQVTLFTLAGLVTPPCMLLAGKLLDKGWGHRLMIAGLTIILLGWLGTLAAPGSLLCLVLAALMLDPCSSTVTISVQQKILSNSPLQIRGRLNSLNISMNFFGGAAGGALGPWILGHYGLSRAVAAAAAVIGALLLATIFAHAR